MTVTPIRCPACAWFHACECRGATLRPQAGDGCVICSYGSGVCPPKRRAQA